MKAKAMYFVPFLILFTFVEVGFSVVPAAVFGTSDNGAAEPLAVAEKLSAPSNVNTTDKDNEIIGPSGTEDLNDTYYGNLAGDENSGDYVTFIGAKAGASGNSGESNTFVGQQSGWKNTSGASNTFVGRDAGALNTEGNYNAFMGRAAGYANTKGERNTFVGYFAGYSTKTIESNTGEYNTFIGSESGRNNTIGRANTFIGRESGYDNTNGMENTFIGNESGRKNISGRYNTFIGKESGYNSTTGWANTFIGMNAGHANTKGYYNTFVGYCAGYSTKTIGSASGNDNTFIGKDAGRNNTIGDYNTFIGMSAGYKNETGSNNVFIGYKAGYNDESSDKLYIDNSDTSSPLIYGDFDTRKVEINGGFRAVATSTSSDARLKRDVEPLASSLDKISSLEGISYYWKRDEYPGFGLAAGKQIGLLAQNVEQVLPELVSEDKDGYKAVSYSKLTVVLVEALKELKAVNQRQKELLQDQLQKQQAEIEELRSIIKELKG